MKITAAFWANHLDIDAQDLLPDDLVDSVQLHKATDFGHLVSILESRTHYIDMVLTILRPTDIEALYKIQQLQQQHPRVPLIAIFDTGSELVLNKNTRWFLENIRNSDFRDIQSLQAIDYSKAGFEDERSAPVLSVDDANGQIESMATGEQEMPYRLTPRQLDVLALLTQGKSNKVIARELGLSEGTVKIHCMGIFRELGVTNRTQAAMCAEKISAYLPDTL